MPPETFGFVDRESDAWELHAWPFVFHNKHVSSGVVWDGHCNLCRTGVEGVSTYHEVKVSEPRVPEGGGTDETGPTPLPHVDGWVWNGDGQLQDSGRKGDGEVPAV